MAAIRRPRNSRRFRGACAIWLACASRAASLRSKYGVTSTTSLPPLGPISQISSSSRQGGRPSSVWSSGKIAAMGPVPPELARDVALERGRVHHLGVHVAEEGHVGDPGHLGGRPGLVLAEPPELRGVLAGVLHAPLARGHDHIADVPALVDPPGNGPARAELDVVWMGADHQHPAFAVRGASVLAHALEASSNAR